MIFFWPFPYTRNLSTFLRLHHTLAESESSCIIYGMPKAAVEAGVIERSVPLGRMAREILAAM